MATYEELIKQGYSYSNDAKKYKSQLDTAMANKPGAYQSAYTTQLNDLYNQITNMQKPAEMTGLYSQIMNRKPFTYDLNGDALYQQYKNQYQTMGKQAMKDTMGQAAALTGGYGSTYGQAVGQQQYNAYLSQLNDRIPELYQLARSNYDADTNNLMQMYGLARDAYDADRSDLYQRYSLVQGRDDTEYGRWKDQLASWQDDVNLYNSLFQNERNWDYGLWQDNISYLMQLAQMAAGGGGRGGRGRSSGGDSTGTYDYGATGFGSAPVNATMNTVANSAQALAAALANGLSNFGSMTSTGQKKTNSSSSGTNSTGRNKGMPVKRETK